MLIEEQVPPNDIDVVRAGLSAKVGISVFKQAEASTLDGVLQTVSADALTDPTTGVPYYLARNLTHDLGELPRDAELHPGMPAKIMIITGEQTALEYLTEPIRLSLRRSIKEGRMKASYFRPSLLGMSTTIMILVFAFSANSNSKHHTQSEMTNTNIDRCNSEGFKKHWNEYKRGKNDSSILIAIMMMFGRITFIEPADENSIMENKKILASILALDNNLTEKGLSARKKMFRWRVLDFFKKDNSWNSRKKFCISNWNDECTTYAIDNEIIFEKNFLIEKIDREISKGRIPYCYNK